MIKITLNNGDKLILVPVGEKAVEYRNENPTHTILGKFNIETKEIDFGVSEAWCDSTTVYIPDTHKEYRNYLEGFIEPNTISGEWRQKESFVTKEASFISLLQSEIENVWPIRNAAEAVSSKEAMEKVLPSKTFIVVLEK